MPTLENTNQGHDNPATIPTPIAFRGSLTVPNAYAAISLAQPLGNKIAMWIIRAFWVAALVYLCWLTAYAYYDGDYNLARMALAGVVLFLIPICVSIGREIWYRKRAEQLCKEGKLLYAPTEGEVDDNSIHSKTDVGEGTLNWSAFCGYRQSESVAVLYLHYPASYLIMARSKFSSDQDWDNFLQTASQKLTKR